MVPASSTLDALVARGRSARSFLVKPASAVNDPEHSEPLSGRAVDLRPRTGGQRIEGFVRLADGRALEGLIISFRAAETGRTVGRVAFTDERGVFAMDGLEEAPYLVEVVDFAGRFEPAEPALARSDGRPLEIILEERAR